MNKRKMKAFACATAATLAFVPFLGGCAAGDEAATDANNPGAAQELAYDEQQRNEAEGSIGQETNYGQVMAVNGNTVTVVLGDLGTAQDGSRAFNSGQNEVTFDVSGVKVVDQTGAKGETPTLSADDMVYMEGEGSGTDFHPTMIEIIDIADAGSGASDAMVPDAK